MARTRSKAKKVRFTTTSVSKIKFSRKAVETLQKQLAAQSERDYASHRGKHVGNWFRNIRDEYERAHPVDADNSVDSDDTLIPPKDENKAPSDNYRIGKFRHFSRITVKLFSQKRIIATFVVRASKWVKMSPQN